jgi:hypothetical protein
MIVETAIVMGNLIGWRITLSTGTYLIWRDQKGMAGIRAGDHFIPGLGETIEYNVVYSS